MNQFNKAMLLVGTLAFLGGCAHSIQVTPSLDQIRSTELTTKSEKTVGYYIDSADLNKEVITPGGGGDKVRYSPYADTQAALNTMLQQVFAKVYSVPSLTDSEFLTEKGISYIFQPKIKTDSSSASMFAWPPTKFVFELSCTAFDPSGAKIWEEKVVGNGEATFSEFKGDFALSAKRASDEAFKKMLSALSSAGL